MSLLLDLIVKPSIVLVLALAAMPLLRQRSAALRHAVLAAALLCAAAVPFAGPLVPAWHVPLASVLLREPLKTPGSAVATTESVVVATGIVQGCWRATRASRRQIRRRRLLLDPRCRHGCSPGSG